MTLALRIYLPGDEFTVAARDDFQDAFTKAGHRLPSGPTWTLHEAGHAVGLGGVDLIDGRDGEWEAWAYLSDMTPRQWVCAIAYAREVLAYVKRAFWVTRIHATAGNGEKGERVLTAMGFQATGLDNVFGSEFIMENV
jgi:hypothetical protein